MMMEPGSDEIGLMQDTERTTAVLPETTQPIRTQPAPQATKAAASV